ncbi:hypothetical protein JKP88DRAFT_348774 [Tribonema minus]|uniref:Peptidase S54 rhomboid domain-containing protein n=1 Tax=Tribonema minus TaxID=303371 RepID=A0A835Z3R5_9STRA|nr:hypothetical protein JKP88DRAFT_348774 [Tribonema minus]
MQPVDVDLVLHSEPTVLQPIAGTPDADGHPDAKDAAGAIAPVTFLLCMLQLTVYVYSRRRGAAAVAVTYRSVVLAGEAWRVLAAAACHAHAPHLLLDVLGLWAARRCEVAAGPAAFLARSAVFLVLSQVLFLLVHHQLVTRGVRAALDAPCLGSTGVVIAWMAFAAAQPRAPPYVLPGGIALPVRAALIIVLLINNIVSRRAGAVSSIGGVLAGNVAAKCSGGSLAALGLLDFLCRPYWLGTTLAWGALVLLASVRATTNVPVPFFDAVSLAPPPAADVPARPFDPRDLAMRSAAAKAPVQASAAAAACPALAAVAALCAAMRFEVTVTAVAWCLRRRRTSAAQVALAPLSFHMCT